MRAALVIGWVCCGSMGCSAGSVQALVPTEAGAAASGGIEPAASDYSAHLDLMALGYDDGSFEVRSPAPQHVLSRGKHDAGIVNVAVSFDGQRLATADRAGVIAVSEIGSGELKMLPRAASAEVGVVKPIGLAWDHAGKRLAVASGNTVRVLRVDSGETKEAQLTFDVNALAFSVDDRELVAGGARIAFLGLPDMNETRNLKLPTEYGWNAEHPNVLDLRFNADGSVLGAQLDVGIALYDLHTQQVDAALIKDVTIVGLRFATSGKIAVFGRQALYVGPAKLETVKQELHKTEGRFWDVEFRRDDSLLFFGDGIEGDVEALLE